MNEAIVTPKAKNLRLLKDAAYPVPPFFVIPASELELSAREGIGGFVQLMETYRRSEADFFSSQSLFAVRSSALAEDGRESSLAGLYHSMLDVEEKDLPEALYRCWQAAGNDTLRFYREKQRSLNEGSGPGLDLIIQAMVEDLSHSAILFTSNPDGLLNERVLVAGEGRGTLLVEDRIPAVNYYRHATEGSGYYENPYGLDLLGHDVLMSIWTMADRIEADFGPALDLELAINQSGEIFLLQMRPITTLDRRSFVSPGTILDNSNIVESYPGLSLPLSTDFYHRAYHGVFSGLIKRLLPHPPASVAQRLDDIAANMVFSRNGRAYYQLNNWLLLLRHLPFQKRILPVWREMMGIEKTMDMEDAALIAPFARFGMVIRLLRSVQKIDRLYEKLASDVRQIDLEYRRLESRSFVPELYEMFFNRIAETLLANWDITLINDLAAMLYSGRLKKKAAVYGIKDTNKLLSGFSALASMKPVRSLSSIRKKIDILDPLLLEKAATNDNEARLILSGNHLALQSDDARRLIKQMNEHIDFYGDRSIEELKLERPTQRSNPSLFFSALLAAPEKLPDYENENANEDLHPDLRRLHARAEAAISRREESRLLRTRVYGIVRSMFTRLGGELFERGIIDDKTDVFYLSIDDVFAAFQGTKEPRKAILRQKARYLIYCDLPAYGRLIFQDRAFSNEKTAELLDMTEFDGIINELGGTPSSPGLVRGEVKLVYNAAAASDIKGKILVTKSTDPGWVYLMLQAGGIVAERGSVLSHTAIISRELGLPSVVGVKNATAILSDGDLIEVDGTSGRIRILERKDNKDI